MNSLFSGESSLWLLRKVKCHCKNLKKNKEEGMKSGKYLHALKTVYMKYKICNIAKFREEERVGVWGGEEGRQAWLSF